MKKIKEIIKIGICRDCVSARKKERKRERKGWWRNGRGAKKAIGRRKSGQKGREVGRFARYFNNGCHSLIVEADAFRSRSQWLDGHGQKCRPTTGWPFLHAWLGDARKTRWEPVWKLADKSSHSFRCVRL